MLSNKEICVQTDTDFTHAYQWHTTCRNT